MPEAQKRLRVAWHLGRHILDLNENVDFSLVDEYEGGITNLALNLGRSYNEAITRKRVKAFKRPINVVQWDMIRNKKYILTVKKDLAIYQANTLQKYKDIVVSLNRLRNETQSSMRYVAILEARQIRAKIYNLQIAWELYTKELIW